MAEGGHREQGGSGRIESYRDLRVWQMGMKLAVECYRLTKDFPREEIFGLTSQIRRAASSIPANIAEGWGREAGADNVRFLRIAQGSLKELETHLLLSVEVDLCPEAAAQPALVSSADLGRMLRSPIRSMTE